MILPPFGPRAEFFDVEGIPVSLNPDAPGVRFSMAWDTDPPRVFDPSSARRNGAPIGLEEFRALVASFHGALQAGEAPRSAEPAAPVRDSNFHPPEVQARIDEFRRQIGAALTKGLNAGAGKD